MHRTGGSMEDLRNIAFAVHDDAVSLDIALCWYSMHHSIRDRDDALQRIARLKTLLGDAERRINEDEQELIKKGLRVSMK